MEQTVQKKNPLIVVVIILVVALLGAIGFIVYDKVINKNETPKTSNTQTTTTNTTNNDALTTDTKVVEKTSDERYAEFLKNLKQKRESEKIYQINYYKGSSLFCSDEYSSVSISPNGDLEVSGDSKEDIVDKNVLTYFVGKIGNGGCSALVYLKEDGTINDAWKENDKINTRKEEYKNIVSMTTGLIDDGDPSGGRDIFYIDIDGNIVN